MKSLWPEEYECLRAEARQAMRPFIEQVSEKMAAVASDRAARVQLHRALLLARAVDVAGGCDEEIGGLPCRVFRPEGAARGVYLHFHGGGLISGAARVSDPANAHLCERMRIAVVSVDYRLAPEHPYPAALDDGLAVANWIVENARSSFGSSRLIIGGESAGGYISAATLLQLRDRSGAAHRFAGANLVFAGYDLSLSLPSSQGRRVSSVPDVLSPQALRLTSDCFLPEMSEAQRRDPAISPMYADLRGMPPALFTVGSADHVLDDNILFAGRWRAAGNEAVLAIYPDCAHGFTRFPMELARRAQARIDAFFEQVLQSPE